MKRILFLTLIFLSVCSLKAQNIGIGTPSPNASAQLDISSTTKGVLMPRLTTAQRNAIVNPAEGLMIYNTTIDAPEVYSTQTGFWSKMCVNCGIYIDTIKVSRTITYSFSDPTYKKYKLVINAGVNVIGTPYDEDTIAHPGIDLSNLPNGSIVEIRNEGSIYGHGGKGGSGKQYGDAFCDPEIKNATKGYQGGHAIFAGNKSFSLVVTNLGLIAAGGGGASAYFSNTRNGGGGGIPFGKGGAAGYSLIAITVCFYSYGTAGTDATINSRGLPGGGLIASTGTGYNGLAGGLPGKAVKGNAGQNIINNIFSGQVAGVID